MTKTTENDYETKIKYLKERLQSEKHIYADHIASLIKENERVHSTFQGELSAKILELTQQIEILTAEVKKLKLAGGTSTHEGKHSNIQDNTQDIGQVD